MGGAPRHLLQAVENGAEVRCGAELNALRREGDWLLDMTHSEMRAGLVVVNPAGNFGDLVHEMLIGWRYFSIRPRKGQFVVYDKPAALLVRHILLPVPTAVTNGVVVCRTAFGNLLVGPIAEDQDDRQHVGLDLEKLAALARRGEEIVLAPKTQEATAIYAGLRPATERKDYCITAHEGLSCLTVGCIRSTGLSGALGIARHVERLAGLALAPPADPVWLSVRNIPQLQPHDWEKSDHTCVVCHCELITRREIMDALPGPLPARSRAELKRHTD